MTGDVDRLGVSKSGVRLAEQDSSGRFADDGGIVDSGELQGRGLPK